MNIKLEMSCLTSKLDRRFGMLQPRSKTNKEKSKSKKRKYKIR